MLATVKAVIGFDRKIKHSTTLRQETCGAFNPNFSN